MEQKAVSEVAEEYSGTPTAKYVAVLMRLTVPPQANVTDAMDRSIAMDCCVAGWVSSEATTLMGVEVVRQRVLWSSFKMAPSAARYVTAQQTSVRLIRLVVVRPKVAHRVTLFQITVNLVAVATVLQTTSPITVGIVKQLR